MLRSITAKNYIHFKTKQHLEFKNGPNFIVGANASGKSALFELARRTLSKTINTSTSSITIESEPAFCISKYERAHNTFVYCCLFHLPALSTPECKHKKLVVYSEKTKSQIRWHCLIDGKDRDESDDVDGLQEKRANDVLELVKLLCVESSQSDTDNVTTICEKIGSIIREIPENLQNTACEDYLKILSDEIIFTFPLRSIGPLQWSKSLKIDAKHKDANYKLSLERAEILTTLIKENTKYGAGDPDKEETIFKTIIYPESYKFTDTLGLKRTDSEDPLPLLKVPEGILEAKQLSLLLTHKNTKTLFLEEPDHGMHPQMIGRVRDIVLRQINDKVVIIISNNPAMINAFTLQKMHVMRSKKSGSDYQHIAKRMPKALSKKEAKTQYFFSNENMKKALFSKRILFVEGVTDELLVGRLFDELIQNQEALKETLQQRFTDKQIQSLACLVTSIDVIKIEGKGNMVDARNFAVSTDVPYCFLLDKDAFLDPEKYNNVFKECSSIIYNNDEIPISTYRMKVEEYDGTKRAEVIKDNCDIENHLKETFGRKEAINHKILEKIGIPWPKDDGDLHQTLQENKIFIWKEGNLEEMINAYVMEDSLTRIPIMKDINLAFPLNKKSEKKLQSLSQEKLPELIAMLLKATEGPIMNFLNFLLSLEGED